MWITLHSLRDVEASIAFSMEDCTFMDRFESLQGSNSRMLLHAHVLEALASVDFSMTAHGGSHVIG